MSEIAETIGKNRQEDKETYEKQSEAMANGINGLIGGIATGSKQIVAAGAQAAHDIGEAGSQAAQQAPGAIDHTVAQAIDTVHDGVRSVPILGALVGGAAGAVIAQQDDLASTIGQINDALPKSDSKDMTDENTPDWAKPQGGDGQDRQLADEPDGASDQQATNDLQAE